MSCGIELSDKDFKGILAGKIARDGRVTKEDRKVLKEEASAEYKRLAASTTGALAMKARLGSRFEQTINLEELNEYVFQKDPTQSKFENINREMIALDQKRDGVNFDSEWSEHLSGMIKELSGAMETMAGLDIKVTKQEADQATRGQYNSANKTVTVAVEEDLGAEFRNEFTQSHQEVYGHESVHAVLEYAFEEGGSEVQDDLAQLRRLWEKSSKELTYKDLLPKDESLYTEASIAEAKSKYEYIYKSKDAKEFTAHLMTNKEFATALESVGSRTIVDKIKGESFIDSVFRVFKNIVNKIIGRVKDKGEVNARVAATRLVFKLAKAEKNAADVVAGKANVNIGLKGLKLYTRGMDAADKKFGEMASTITKATIGDVEKRTGKKMTKKDLDQLVKDTDALAKMMSDMKKQNKYMQVVTVMRALPKWRVMQNDLPEVARMTDSMLTSIGLRENTNMREIVNDFMQQDQTYTALTDAILKSTKEIDGAREEVYEHVKGDVKSWFKNVDLSKKKNFIYDEALSEVILRPDVQALDMTAKELAVLLRDKKALSVAYRTEMSKMNLAMRHSVDELAKYMMTGVGLVSNPVDIVRVDGSMQFSGDEAVKAVDRATSLRALSKLDARSVEVMLELIEKDEAAVDKFIGYARGLQSNNIEKEGYVKGYIKESFDRDAVMLVRPKADQKKMEQKGFRLIKKLDKLEGEGSVEMGLYVSKYGAVAKRVNGAINIQGEDKIGRGIRDRILEEGKLSSKEEVKKEFKKRLAELAKLSMQEDTKLKVSPVYRNGLLVDFVETMSFADKRKYRKMEGRGSENLARSHGHAGQAERVRQVNKELLLMIKKDYDNNFASNPNKYEKIIPRQDSKKKAKADEIENAELYALLPKGTKEDIKEIFKDGTLIVRRDLIRPLMGYREASLADVFKSDKIIDEGVKTKIRVFEKYWQDMMQIAKGNIVIKMPGTLIGNIISNTKLLLIAGVNPVQSITLMLQAGEQLLQYEKDTRELGVLEVELKAGMSSDEARIAQLRDAISRNKVTPLIEAGLYQSVVEDVSNASDTNRVSAWGSEKLDKWLDPERKITMPLNTAVNYAFMTDKTAPYRMMLKATQVSDFYARYTQYYNAIEEKKTSPADAMRDVVDNYINYETPLNKWVHYGDRMGMLFFINYYVKSQRVVVKLAKKHPVRSAADISTQFFLGDTPDIWDTSFIDQDLDFSPFKPLGHVADAIFPSGVRLVEDFL